MFERRSEIRARLRRKMDEHEHYERWQREQRRRRTLDAIHRFGVSDNAGGMTLTLTPEVVELLSDTSGKLGDSEYKISFWQSLKWILT